MGFIGTKKYTIIKIGTTVLLVYYSVSIHAYISMVEMKNENYLCFTITLIEFYIIMPMFSL